MTSKKKNIPDPVESGKDNRQKTVYNNADACIIQCIALIFALGVIFATAFLGKDYHSFYISGLVQSIANITIFLGVNKKTHTKFICQVKFWCLFTAFMSLLISLAGIQYTSSMPNEVLSLVYLVLFSVPLVECLLELHYFVVDD